MHIGTIYPIKYCYSQFRIKKTVAYLTKLAMTKENIHNIPHSVSPTQ